jgi:hypothetical protein
MPLHPLLADGFLDESGTTGIVSPLFTPSL